MCIATFDEPGLYLDKWQGLREGKLEIEEPDECITWDDFLETMNWTDEVVEASSIGRILDVENDFKNARKQLIFYGAPGTGKTKAALEICNLIASNHQCIERVQFHQSYSYENFIEGIRPVTKNGVLTYEVEPGPFVKFCRKALKQPNKRFVFVVDEINRGNLSRIFGELMFLLEYRDNAMPLLYSKTNFQIPSNVYIVGTMNSADRSIALVDYALRRRFSFVEFKPSSDVLAAWYDSESADHLRCIRFFDALNDMICENDRRLAIGHSYLLIDYLKSGGLTKSALEDTWVSSIYPLLEEYFCNLPSKLSQFDFGRLWASVKTSEPNLSESA